MRIAQITYSALKYNKQFKSDSARMAFLVWGEFSVYGGLVKCRGRVLHTLIGRYGAGQIQLRELDE
ncbi:hypothetical protein VYH28_004757 [Vibrio alginolyticus]|nr:hypothetical protein [Vibrio alginolyticus]EME3939244.1 hypothetical protein [Vibrio alginolyticus]